MTDDLVARLRHEQELCTVMGDTASGALVGEAADRLEVAEARVRELEAELATMEARAIATDLAVVKAAKVATAKAIERAAKKAASYDDGLLVYDSQGHTVLSRHGNQISAAIRKLAQEVKHEAE